MKERKLYLTNDWITFLFGYYFIIFVIGLVVSIYVVTNAKVGNEILTFALWGSIGMAMNGSSIFYIRKLYKLCFDNKKLEISNGSYKEILATIIYFVARPLFSIGFALLIVIGFKSGFMTTSVTEVKLNEGFIYLTMFISFFIGFLTSQFIRKLENDGNKVINVLPNQEG